MGGGVDLNCGKLQEVVGVRKHYTVVGRTEEAREHSPSHSIPRIPANAHRLPPCAVLNTDIYTSSFNPHKNLVRSFLVSFPLCRGRNPDRGRLPKPLNKCVGEGGNEPRRPGTAAPAVNNSPKEADSGQHVTSPLSSALTLIKFAGCKTGCWWVARPRAPKPQK